MFNVSMKNRWYYKTIENVHSVYKSLISIISPFTMVINYMPIMVINVLQIHIKNAHYNINTHYTCMYNTLCYYIV